MIYDKILTKYNKTTKYMYMYKMSRNVIFPEKNHAGMPTTSQSGWGGGEELGIGWGIGWGGMGYRGGIGV